MNYSERDLVRTLDVRPAGTGGQYELNDGRLQNAYDFTPSAIYVGSAPLGALTSAAAWTIKRIELDTAGNPISTTWTAIRSAIWDDHLTESYT